MMALHNNQTVRKFSLGIFIALYSLLSQNPNVSSQNVLIAEKYSKIIPGISTRDEIEQIFAAAKSGEYYKEENVVEFEDKKLAIRVEYSTGKCGDTLPDYGTFPKWTVIAVSYMWPNDDQIPLEGVILDLRKFSRVQTSDVVVHDNYVNDEAGIDIVYDRKRKSVDGIYLKPNAGLRAKYGKCP